jgi:exodeoxyribonuclease VII large subunit
MLIDPKKKIEENFLRVDDLVNRVQILTSWTFRRKREISLHLNGRLYLQNPILRVKGLRLVVSETTRRYRQIVGHILEIQKQKMVGFSGKLGSLNPLSILQRGYSITRKLPSLQILRDAVLVKEGDKVEVKLHRGTLSCSVEKTKIS